jgi:hypothetical protein
MKLAEDMDSAKLERSTVLLGIRRPYRIIVTDPWTAIEICIASRSCVVASYSSGVLGPSQERGNRACLSPASISLLRTASAGLHSGFSGTRGYRFISAQLTE